MSLDNFGVNQRLFNIYDGPSFQDSNAYLDITPTTLATASLRQTEAAERLAKAWDGCMAT